MKSFRLLLALIAASAFVAGVSAAADKKPEPAKPACCDQAGKDAKKCEQCPKDAKAKEQCAKDGKTCEQCAKKK